jgi:hypothetical protein
LSVFQALAAEARIRHTGDGWLDDPVAYQRMMRGWERLLAALGPPRPPQIVIRLPMTPEAARDAQELMERYAPASWWAGDDTTPKGFGTIDKAAAEPPDNEQ